MKNTLLGSIYLALAASIWGGMYVVVKVVVAVIPPFELVWIRYVIAILALLIVGLIRKQSCGLIRKQSWKIHKRDLLLIVAIGIVGNTISIVTQEYGTMLSSAQMGAIITSSTPAFMVIFARLLLKEPLNIKKGTSIILATTGVLFIVGNGHIDTSNQLGGISLLVAALTWALMSVLIKRVPNSYSPILVTTYSTFVAIVALTPFVKPSTIFTPLLLDPNSRWSFVFGNCFNRLCFFIVEPRLTIIKCLKWRPLFLFSASGWNLTRMDSAWRTNRRDILDRFVFNS